MLVVVLATQCDGTSTRQLCRVHGVHTGSISADAAVLLSVVMVHRRYVMKELEKSGKYHVIAFDRPPFGLTERPPADASEVSPYSTDGGACSPVHRGPVQDVNQCAVLTCVDLPIAVAFCLARVSC